MNVFLKIFASLRFREAVKKADTAHAVNGHRYYVLPADDKSLKLIVMDRQNFRRLKTKKYINQNARVFHLVNESFYFTPYANGTGCLSAYDKVRKKELYYQWVDACRKRKKLYGKKKSLLHRWLQRAKTKS